MNLNGRFSQLCCCFKPQQSSSPPRMYSLVRSRSRSRISRSLSRSRISRSRSRSRISRSLSRSRSLSLSFSLSFSCCCCSRSRSLSRSLSALAAAAAARWAWWPEDNNDRHNTHTGFIHTTHRGWIRLPLEIWTILPPWQVLNLSQHNCGYVLSQEYYHIYHFRPNHDCNRTHTVHYSAAALVAYTLFVIALNCVKL